MNPVVDQVGNSAERTDVINGRVQVLGQLRVLVLEVRLGYRDASGLDLILCPGGHLVEGRRKTGIRADVGVRNQVVFSIVIG